MGIIAKGILRGCQGLITPVSLGYPLSVFNKNSTLKLLREQEQGTTCSLRRGGGLGSSTIVKKFNEPYAPS